MKKNVFGLFLMLIVMGLTITSCNKDDDEYCSNDPNGLVGTWYPIKVVSVTGSNKPNESLFCEHESVLYHKNGTGVEIDDENDTDVFFWKLEDDIYSYRYGSNNNWVKCNVITLDSESFVYEEESGSGKYKTTKTYYYSRKNTEQVKH